MLVDNYAVTQNCFNLKVIVMDMKLGPCRECWLTWQEPSFYDVPVFHCFQVSLNVFFGKPGPWFEDCELDGDKNSIFHDIDGSVTGYKDVYVGRIDNYLIDLLCILFASSTNFLFISPIPVVLLNNSNTVGFCLNY